MSEYKGPGADWLHAWETTKKGERIYRGFFINSEAANAWLKKRKKAERDRIEITDEGPARERTTPAAKSADKALDAALVATRKAQGGQNANGD